jgi:AcrR family transcriptional regulator
MNSLEPLPVGKQKLIDAGLRLAARDGMALSSLGLRELAREAGLNHNTFYRHFESAAQFSRAVAEGVATQIMAGMKEARRRSARRADATEAAVDYFLDFVASNPDVFVVGLRELHCANSAMRPVLQQLLAAMANESVEQIVTQQLVPVDDRALLFAVAHDITHYMFRCALDALEKPKARKALARDMVAHIRRQFFGAIAQQGQAAALTKARAR